MEFKETQAIYLQIVDLVCDNIMAGKWKAGERVPSVRELGVQLEVNPNTVMRAYDCLQDKQIIYNKRGVGYFVGEEAPAQIIEAHRVEFLEMELPEIFRRMKLLGISFERLAEEYEKYRKDSES